MVNWSRGAGGKGWWLAAVSQIVTRQPMTHHLVGRVDARAVQATCREGHQRPGGGRWQGQLRPALSPKNPSWALGRNLRAVPTQVSNQFIVLGYDNLADAAQ